MGHLVDALLSSPFAFAIEGFRLTVWRSGFPSSFWRSVLPKPTPQQRMASIGFMLAALAATAWLVWPYYRAALLGNWVSESFLVIGILEALIVRYHVLREDQVARNDGVSSPYLIVLLLVWVLSLILGNVLHERKIRQAAMPPQRCQGQARANHPEPTTWASSPDQYTALV
jgi:hypothetical protein